MVPTIVFRNPQITTVVLNCLLYTGVFWTYASGLASEIFLSDITYLALGIAVAILYCNLAMTHMAWELARLIDHRYDHNAPAESLFYTKFDVIAFITVMLPMLGFLGTVIGLTFLMNQAGGVTPENFAVIVGDGTSTALYPTAVGIVGFLFLSLQRFVLTHSFRIHGLARDL